MVTVMFIRFVSGEVDEDSHVPAGIFCAAWDLIGERRRLEGEYCVLRELLDWFNEHLKSPSDYRLKTAWLMERAICWFRPTAHEHLSRAWEMAGILERNGVPIYMIKTREAGYILYEDEAQVFAVPFAETRRAL
jgi:hypothetical protein